MTTIAGLAGSLRKGSFNMALLNAAAAVVSPGTQVEILSLKGIPLYNADEEAESGIPTAVRAIKDRVAVADGLLLVTPEYNSSIPGVFKNAIDWMSRPPKDSARVFANRPVAIMGATPGGAGTILAQDAWLPVIRALGMRPWFGGRMIVSNAGKIFEESGNLIDETTRERLKTFMVGFEQFIAHS